MLDVKFRLFGSDDGEPNRAAVPTGWGAAAAALPGDTADEQPDGWALASGIEPVVDSVAALPGQAMDSAALADARLTDLDWAVLPPGFTSTSIEAPSGTLAAISCGAVDAPPVVLVPGATGSKEDFLLMMPILAAAGYFALSFDMAGQYQSAAAGPEHLDPPRQHYEFGLFVDDLLAVLGTLGRPAHVVGYSFAGTVAGLAYAREPGFFASLALLSCPPQAGQAFRGVSRIGPLTGLANGKVGAALMVWGIRRNFIPVPPGRLRFARDRLKMTRRQSVRDILEMMQENPDISVALAAASLPKLVAVGEHDLWPTHLHAAFAQQVGAGLAVYRSGHSPCETSPHQLCRDLLALYAQN